MASAHITAKAQARKRLEAGDSRFEGYRTMSLDDLQTLLAAPAKGKGKQTAKGRANGTKGRAASRKAVSKGRAQKGRASTSAPAAKSTGRKTTPAKGRAGQGKAKRPTAASSRSNATAKAVNAARSTRVASNGPRPTSQRRTQRGANATAEVHTLGKINWNRESNVGRTGKRKEVLDALRQHKGDKRAAFKTLKRRATRFYPAKSKEDAERMLVWLIGRVAYDYAVVTGQHEPGRRAEYGTSDDPQNVRRRELRAQASGRGRRQTRSQGRSAPASRKSGNQSGKGRATAQKGSQRRTAAKGKGRGKTTRKGR